MSGSPAEVEIEAIDPRDKSAFDEWFAVWHAIDFERNPEGPGWQYEELHAMALDDDGPFERRPLVARRNGAVAGIVGFELPRRENLHLARLELRVLPEQRRHGVGTALVEAAEGMAAAAGRTQLVGKDLTPLRADYVDPAAPFARHLGFTVALVMVGRRIDLPLDAMRADALRHDPRATPAGYSLLTFADRWPDEDLDDRCELGRRMSTDVPTGEAELDEEVWDHARVRALEALLASQNRAKVITAARDDASGRLVGYTEVAVPLGAPESAYQHDTLVMREHRGHGLGFAMKLANLFAVQGWHPGVRCIKTENAEENGPMIAVNADLGFRVVTRSTEWHRPIAPRLHSA
ncbi:MAG TPA: GNAT family N-acetyltransferase [Acidimicrobiales bacterium]